MYRSSLSRPTTMAMAGMVATADQSIAASTATRVGYQALLYPTIGDSITADIAANQFVINREGLYLLSGEWSFRSNQDGRRWCEFRVNTLTIGSRAEQQSLNLLGFIVSTTVYLMPGDVAYMAVYQNASVAVASNVASQAPSMSVTRLA